MHIYALPCHPRRAMLSLMKSNSPDPSKPASQPASQDGKLSPITPFVEYICRSCDCNFIIDLVNKTGAKLKADFCPLCGNDKIEKRTE